MDDRLGLKLRVDIRIDLGTVGATAGTQKALQRRMSICGVPGRQLPAASSTITKAQKSGRQLGLLQEYRMLLLAIRFLTRASLRITSATDLFTNVPAVHTLISSIHTPKRFSRCGNVTQEGPCRCRARADRIPRIH